MQAFPIHENRAMRTWDLDQQSTQFFSQIESRVSPQIGPKLLHF